MNACTLLLHRNNYILNLIYDVVNLNIAKNSINVNILRIRCLLRSSIFVFNFLRCEGTKNTRFNVSRLLLNFSLSRFVHVLALSVFFMFSRNILVFFVSSSSRKLEFSSLLSSRDLFSQPRVLVFSHARIFHVLADYSRKLAFSPRTREYEGTRIRGETNQPP